MLLPTWVCRWRDLLHSRPTWADLLVLLPTWVCCDSRLQVQTAAAEAEPGWGKHSCMTLRGAAVALWSALCWPGLTLPLLLWQWLERSAQRCVWSWSDPQSLYYTSGPAGSKGEKHKNKPKKALQQELPKQVIQTPPLQQTQCFT